MTASTDSLSRAIAYLGAVELAPGLYAYRDDATQRHYIVTEDALARLPRYLDAEIDQRATPMIDIPYAGGYSEWCADTAAIEMPDDVADCEEALMAVPPGPR